MEPTTPPRPADLERIQELVDGFLTQGLTLASLKGLSSEDLETLYAKAWRHLSEGRAADALPDLAMLVTHNPWDARFEFGLALALQLQGEHASAARHYVQALLLSPDDAACALRLGECLEALDESGAACEAYRHCIAISWSAPEAAGVRAYAEAGVDRINRGAAS